MLKCADRFDTGALTKFPTTTKKAHFPMSEPHILTVAHVRGFLNKPSLAIACVEARLAPSGSILFLTRHFLGRRWYPQPQI